MSETRRCESGWLSDEGGWADDSSLSSSWADDGVISGVSEAEVEVCSEADDGDGGAKANSANGSEVGRVLEELRVALHHSDDGREPKRVDDAVTGEANKFRNRGEISLSSSEARRDCHVDESSTKLDH